MSKGLDIEAIKIRIAVAGTEPNATASVSTGTSDPAEARAIERVVREWEGHGRASDGRPDVIRLLTTDPPTIELRDAYRAHTEGRLREFVWESLPFGARLNFTVRAILRQEHPAEPELRWLLSNRPPRSESAHRSDSTQRDLRELFEYVADRWLLKKGPGKGRQASPQAWRDAWDVVYCVRLLQAALLLRGTERGALARAVRCFAEARDVEQESMKRTYRRAVASLRKRAEALRKQFNVPSGTGTGWDPPTVEDCRSELEPLSEVDRRARVQQETGVADLEAG
jgi:hypothetical protein